MSDIFHEVDEEVRREQLRRLWAKYGPYLLALAFIIVAGVAGWRGYEWWQLRKSAEAGAAFEAATTLSTEGKRQEAEAAFNKVAAEGSAGYRSLALLREAAELAPRDSAAAVKVYDGLAADGSLGRTMQDLAALRAGLLLLDTAPYDEMLRRLEGLTANDRAFRHTARELLATAAWRNGDATAARRWLDMMTTDAEMPAGTRSRIDMLRALVGPGGQG